MPTWLLAVVSIRLLVSSLSSPAEHRRVAGGLVALRVLRFSSKYFSFPLQYHPTVLIRVYHSMVIKIQPDATVCRYLFTAKSLYMFRVSQHPSSGVLKTVTATSGSGHNIGTATSLQRDLIRPRWREVAVFLMMGAVTPETCRVTLQ